MPIYISSVSEIFCVKEMREEPEVFRAGEGHYETIDTVVHISCIRKWQTKQYKKQTNNTIAQSDKPKTKQHKKTKYNDKSSSISCEQWIHHTLPLIYIHMHSSETEHSSITITAWYPN